MCGKKVYASWTEANKAARRSHRQYEIPCKPYWCRKCRRFHVGTQPTYVLPSESLYSGKPQIKKDAVA